MGQVKIAPSVDKSVGKGTVANWTVLTGEKRERLHDQDERGTRMARGAGCYVER